MHKKRRKSHWHNKLVNGLDNLALGGLGRHPISALDKKKHDGCSARLVASQHYYVASGNNTPSKMITNDNIAVTETAPTLAQAVIWRMHLTST